MQDILNLIILTFIGFCFSIHQGLQILSVVSFLVALIIALCITLNRKISYLSFIYVFFCYLHPTFILYLPCIFYATIQDRKFHVTYLVYFFSYLFYLQNEPSLYLHFILMCIAWGIRIQYLTNEKIKKQYQKQRDASKELAMLLEEKNMHLLVSQDQDIRIAMLHERNRIAREIHDHVGHLLSSSLLQIGALQAIRNDDQMKVPLLNLRETISSAMDNVRSSVHNLHEEALDLANALQTLCKDFTFCEASLEYDVMKPLDTSISYQLLAIAKECLTNTTKHSNATHVHMIVREHPGFYQFIIRDNGYTQSIQNSGIGLQSIKERIHSLHGYCNITCHDGFQVFITLPKEES